MINIIYAQSGIVDDSKEYQYQQATYNNKTVTFDTIYPYGYSANAPSNSLVLLFNSVTTQTSNKSGIVYSPNDRFKDLVSTEVVVGNPETRSHIIFKANGDIEINSNSGSQAVLKESGDINISPASNTMNITSDINLTGNINATGDIVANGISLKTHLTSGVTPGGGVSGVPI